MIPVQAIREMITNDKDFTETFDNTLIQKRNDYLYIGQGDSAIHFMGTEELVKLVCKIMGINYEH